VNILLIGEDSWAPFASFGMELEAIANHMSKPTSINQELFTDSDSRNCSLTMIQSMIQYNYNIRVLGIV